MALEPEVFVLDEPTSNLDLETIDDLKGIINGWKQCCDGVLRMS